MLGVRLPVVAAIATALMVGAIIAYRVALPEPGAMACRNGATAMARLELLFGMARKDGSEVSEADWRAFLDAEVTPRFPDGLTVLTGYGQWRSGAGITAKETSRVLVIWHARPPGSEAKIEAIRAAYKTRFGQESVLRVDGASCVSF